MQVELNDIDVGRLLGAVLHGDGLIVYDFPCPQLISEIAPFRRNIQLAVVDHHVVQVIVRAHHLAPHPLVNVVVHQNGAHFAVTDHEEAVLIHQLHTAAVIGLHFILAIGTVLVKLPPRRQVVAEQLPVVVEKQNLLTVHLKVLQVTSLQQRYLLGVLLAVHHLTVVQPDVAVQVDKHVGHPLLSPVGGKEAVHVGFIVLRRQEHATHAATALQPQVMVVVEVQVIVPVIVFQLIDDFLVGVDTRKTGSVEEVDVADGRNGHASGLGAFDGLRRVVGKTI